MYSLSSSELLKIWENGFKQTITERTIVILTAALPTLTLTDIHALTIGERNQHLLRIRERVFGVHIPCTSHCPHCGDAVEFTLDTEQLTTPTQPATDFVCSMAGNTYTFRLITCHDLLLAAQQPTLIAAERLLIEQCLATTESRIDITQLSDHDIQLLSEQLKRHDPQAELLVNLSCPVCTKSWETAFDIATFLWEEIAALAKQLLTEVHCLAQAYGWDEATVLALSQKRRQYYLSQVML